MCDEAFGEYVTGPRLSSTICEITHTATSANRMWTLQQPGERSHISTLSHNVEQQRSCNMSWI